jgi:FkbM family methyltransferase
MIDVRMTKDVLMTNSKLIPSQATTKAMSFRHWQGYLQYRLEKLRRGVFKRLAKRSLPLVFRGGDIIAQDPLANGYYEPEIKSLIDHFSQTGYGDFLLDIGANIGLSSCQSGMHFKTVHMFEPNPNCVDLLKINTRIALRGCQYTIHEYGLGAHDETLQLHVPHDNWGGAFIKSSDNEYDEHTLLAKEGSSRASENAYDVVPVKIQNARRILASLFQELVSQNLSSGVIKIDVEGYEKFIIHEILATLPQDVKVAIIFENWMANVDVAQYFGDAMTSPSHPFILFKLQSQKNSTNTLPRWANSWLNVWRGGFTTDLRPAGNVLDGGTYVLLNQ